MRCDDARKCANDRVNSFVAIRDIESCTRQKNRMIGEARRTRLRAIRLHPERIERTRKDLAVLRRELITADELSPRVVADRQNLVSLAERIPKVRAKPFPDVDPVRDEPLQRSGSDEPEGERERRKMHVAEDDQVR